MDFEIPQAIEEEGGAIYHSKCRFYFTEKHFTGFKNHHNKGKIKINLILNNLTVLMTTTNLIRYSSLSVVFVQYLFSTSGNCDIAKVDGANSVRFLLGSDK